MAKLKSALWRGQIIEHMFNLKIEFSKTLVLEYAKIYPYTRTFSGVRTFSNSKDWSNGMECIHY